MKEAMYVIRYEKDHIPIVKYNYTIKMTVLCAYMLVIAMIYLYRQVAHPQSTSLCLPALPLLRFLPCLAWHFWFLDGPSKFRGHTGE